MTPEELNGIAGSWRVAQQGYVHQINVCAAASCLSCGGGDVRKALEAEINRCGLEKRCHVKPVGCMGPCSAGPVVSIAPAGIYYRAITAEDASAIVEALGKDPVQSLVFPETESLDRQFRVVLENSGKIDPEKIEDYIAVEGYSALVGAIMEMSPEKVVAEVTASGLRGRGGAGFPTGLKWSTVAKSRGTQKYVVCNADEGDPGAFMDRSVLESDPHRVLEGMALAAFAVGANKGYIYCRAEYPLAVKRLKTAIRQAERLRFLGSGICDTGFSFHLEIRLGAGAFVCGEETALIASIEGGRGLPSPRPPYPAQSGIWGCPTLINNVETLASIPPIVRKGGAWYAGIGTEKSKGTKVFALAGRVNNTGLIEVPMGTSLREIVFEIGGGIPDGRKFKAVQTGGPSGGCIPEQYLDMPVDYESLAQAGSIMGSGGMIVMDETSCMVDVARYFMEFCMSESCGKCIPCRVGTAEMYDLLTKITTGRGTMRDLHLLEELSDLVKNTSLCGLGQTAPNPLLSTLRCFPEEYHAHITDKVCPAGTCQMQGTGELIS